MIVTKSDNVIEYKWKNPVTYLSNAKKAGLLNIPLVTEAVDKFAAEHVGTGGNIDRAFRHRYLTEGIDLVTIAKIAEIINRSEVSVKRHIYRVATWILDRYGYALILDKPESREIFDKMAPDNFIQPIINNKDYETITITKNKYKELLAKEEQIPEPIYSNDTGSHPPKIMAENIATNMLASLRIAHGFNGEDLNKVVENSLGKH